MDVIISSVLWQLALAHLDDIVMFSRRPQDYIEQVRRTLRLLYKASVIRKLKKWKFFAENIDYLGHVNRTGRLQFAQYTLGAVQNLQHPTTQTELC